VPELKAIVGSRRWGDLYYTNSARRPGSFVGPVLGKCVGDSKESKWFVPCCMFLGEKNVQEEKWATGERDIPAGREGGEIKPSRWGEGPRRSRTGGLGQYGRNKRTEGGLGGHVSWRGGASKTPQTLGIAVRPP